MRPLLLLIALTTVCAMAEATILRVAPGNGQYASIPEAVAAASANDTILVGSSADPYGIGSEDLILTFPLHIIGSGWPNASTLGTTVNLGGYRIRFRPLASGSSFESIALQNPPVEQTVVSDTMVAAIVFDSLTSNVSVKRVIFPCPGGSCSCPWAECPCYKSIALLCQGGNAAIFIDDCVFYNIASQLRPSAIVCSGGGSGIIVANSLFGTHGIALSIIALADVSIMNCVVWYSTLDLGGQTLGMMNNNILWSSSVSSLGSITMSYNAGNGSPVGSDWLSLSETPFVNFPDGSHWFPNTYDLHLASGSPCIDAGVPNQTDRDGSRVDLGIYGGQSPFVDSGIPIFPMVTGLSIPATVPQNGVLPIYSTGRVGPGN